MSPVLLLWTKAHTSYPPGPLVGSSLQDCILLLPLLPSRYTRDVLLTGSGDICGSHTGGVQLQQSMIQSDELFAVREGRQYDLWLFFQTHYVQACCVTAVHTGTASTPGQLVAHPPGTLGLSYLPVSLIHLWQPHVLCDSLRYHYSLIPC